MFKTLSNPFKILVMAILLMLIPAATSATERLTSVLIFPLRVSGVSLSNSQKVEIRNYLATRLTIEGVYMAMPEAQIKQELGAAKVESYNECNDDACRIELGAAIYADKSLSVDVVAERKRCRVTASIYNIKQEVPESGADVVTGCTYEDIKMAMVAVAAQLSGKKVPLVQSETAGNYQNTFAAAPELNATSSSSVSADNLPTIKAETGYLSVEGSPKGARVDISGPKEFGEKGKVATALPVRPAQVPAGNYTVKVSWTDYDTEEKTVRVYADATETVKIDLVKSTGELELSGKPEGAKSRLECQKGFTKDFGLPGSPVTVTVPRGECRVTVERDGYEKYDNRVAVEGGQVSRVKVDLKREMVDAAGGSGGSGGSGPGGVQWVRIPGGSFQMGSNNGSGDEKPVHTVNVPTFEIAKTEVTVAQYRKCIEAGACSKPHWDDGSCKVWNGGSSSQGNLPSSFRGDNQPIVCIDWDQANAYAKWVGGRLPTEAEWEYAARAGTAGERYGDIKAIAWYGGNSGNQTRPVGQKQANKFGLNDMLGNVWEWCQDWYHGSYNGAPSNGSLWESPQHLTRVNRGGSWVNGDYLVRIAMRSQSAPDSRYSTLGLRPARSVR